MWVGAAEGAGDPGFVAVVDRASRRCGAGEFCRARGVARRGAQDGECGDGAGIRRAGVSGGHAYSPAGAAVEIDERKKRGANGSGFEKTISARALERVAPTDYFLRSGALLGAWL